MDNEKPTMLEELPLPFGLIETIVIACVVAAVLPSRDDEVSCQSECHAD
jgi:hypothetical protein